MGCKNLKTQKKKDKKGTTLPSLRGNSSSDFQKKPMPKTKTQMEKGKTVVVVTSTPYLIATPARVSNFET